MDDKLHYKKCGEALVIIPNNEWKEPVLKAFELQELYCPNCNRAYMTATRK